MRGYFHIATHVTKLQRENLPPTSNGELAVPEIVACVAAYGRAKTRRDQAIALQTLTMLRNVYQRGLAAGAQRGGMAST